VQRSFILRLHAEFEKAADRFWPAGQVVLLSPCKRLSLLRGYAVHQVGTQTAPGNVVPVLVSRGPTVRKSDLKAATQRDGFTLNDADATDRLRLSVSHNQYDPNQNNQSSNNPKQDVCIASPAFHLDFAFNPSSTSRRMASNRETSCFCAQASSAFMVGISNRAGIVPPRVGMQGA